jgi:hypothetical protein
MKFSKNTKDVISTLNRKIKEAKNNIKMPSVLKNNFTKSNKGVRYKNWSVLPSAPPMESPT